MQTTMAPTITRVIHTASANSTIYGISEEGRVFTADGSVPPAARTWTRYGVLVRGVRLGRPLLIVIDDMVARTSPVAAEVRPQSDR